ncbi:hypothetical protein OAF45_02400 [Candidatus Latescibacteria bacterium]|nr:hypothetical protein [Candidatus Latescibacterota bacterium]
MAANEGLSRIAWVFRALGLIGLVCSLAIANNDGQIDSFDVMVSVVLGGIPFTIAWIIKGFAKKGSEDQ